MKNACSLLFIICFLVFSSCRTAQNKEDKKNSITELEEVKKNSEDTFQENLILLFGGDIMAHKPNYSLKDYSIIWKDISSIVKSSDFSFANIEAPVDNSLPYDTYPRFNMQEGYPKAAIDAGFNVFSLSNNHSNDKGATSIQNTINWANETEKLYKDSEREVFFSGLKKTKDDSIGYKIIKKNGWTIIFCAITELLNSTVDSECIDYVAPNTTARNQFKEYVTKLQNEIEHDIFILSIHTNVPEYVHTISKSQRNYYYSLLDCGIDIIWANHPHVVQEIEFIGNKTDERFSKLIMYANGNTISAQRTNPNFTSPSNYRDYTGDGLLYKVKFYKKDKDSIAILDETKAHYITTYINTAHQYVIKNLDNNFIEYLKSVNRFDWMRYIAERKKIMENTKVRKTWQ